MRVLPGLLVTAAGGFACDRTLANNLKHSLALDFTPCPASLAQTAAPALSKTQA